MFHVKRFTFVCIMTILLSSINIFASSSTNKQYIIKSADFKVQLLEYGDATITETWTVDFTNGNFSRFYVERSLGVPKEEKFSDIIYHSFTINGNPCIPNYSSKKIPGTYSVSTKDGVETYTWHIDAKNKEMIFETQYTLQNVVKDIEDGYALFSYRFIDKNFRKEIQNLSIEIYPPQECKIQIKEGEGYNLAISSDSLRFSKNNSNELAKISIAMPKEVFLDTISSIHDAKQSDSYDQSGSSKKGIGFFTYIIFILLLISLFRSKIQSFMLNILSAFNINTSAFSTSSLSSDQAERLANDPDKVKSILNRFMTLNVTPIEYNLFLGEHFTGMNAFRLIYLDLIRKSIISIDDSSLYIDMGTMNNLKDYERKLIEILVNNMPFNTNYQTKSILLSKFFSNFTANYRQLSRLMGSLEKMLKVAPIDGSLKEDAAILKAYLNKHSTVYSHSTYDIFKYYDFNRTIDLMVLYYLASSTPTRHSKVDSKYFPLLNQHVSNAQGFYYEFAYILDTSAPKYILSIKNFLSGGNSSNSSSGHSGGGGVGGSSGSGYDSGAQ